MYLVLAALGLRCAGRAPVAVRGLRSTGRAGALWWLLLSRSTGSWRPASVLAAPGFWSTGSVVVANLVAPQRLGPSRMRDGAHVSRPGRRFAAPEPAGKPFHRPLSVCQLVAYSSPPPSQLWGRLEPGSQFLTVFSLQCPVGPHQSCPWLKCLAAHGCAMKSTQCFVTGAGRG